MKFGKNANMHGKWQYVYLSDTEVEEASEELRNYNLKEARMCESACQSAEILKALLEKQLVTIYTHLSQKIDEKINKMRDEANNRGKNFGTYEKKPYVPKEEPPKGKSLLSKVYENLENAESEEAGVKGDEQLDDV